ncbi:unnamed protein product, partial [Mesorhabditis belari]|uniref:Ion transport domain-containing protein n=1 Tax=Mesorhabditis belari TaxID=2138241 RepID=A0AAF3FCS8_9BILA
MSHLFVLSDFIDAIEELESPTATQTVPILSHTTRPFTWISRMLLLGNNETNSIDDATMEAPNEFPLEPLGPQDNAQNSSEIIEQEPTKTKRGEIGIPQISVDMEENRERAFSEMARSPPHLFSIEEDNDNPSHQAAQERNPLLGERRATSLEMFDKKNANLSDRERNPSAKSAILTHTNSGSSLPNRAAQRKFFANTPKKKETNKYHTNAERILSVINHYMGLVIQKHKIEDLHDRNLAELLCYAFYGHRDTFAKWKECKAPLYSALLVIFVSEKLWSRFDYIYESDVADIFMSQKKKFDEASKMLLEVCHSADFKRTRELLCERYIPSEKMDSNGGTLLGLANMGNAENFFSHKSCQRIVEDRWKPGFRCNKKIFFFTFLFFGLPLLFSKSIIHFTGEKYQSRWQRFLAFHGSPCGKFAWHTFLYAIYVIVFGFYVQQAHKVDNVMNVFTVWALLMLVWQALFFVEACIEFILQERGKQAFNSTLSQHLKVNHFHTILHFLIVVVNSVFLIAALLIDNERAISLNLQELVTAKVENVTMQEVLSRENNKESNQSITAVIRLFLLSASEVTFLVSFVFSAIRMLRVFTVDPFFGSIVMTIRRMVQLFVYFSVILAVFWIVYGVCQIALQGRKEEHSVIWQIFSNGAFEIFGELETPLKEGSILGCNVSFKWEKLQDFSGQSVQCAVRSWLVPLVLFLYTLTSSILVINILTTLINQQYEEVSDRAEQNWRSLKYRRMVEYEIKMFFPPPLTPLNLISNFLKRLKAVKVKEDEDHQKPAKYFYCDKDPEKSQKKGTGEKNELNLLTGKAPIKELTLREFEGEARTDFLMDLAEEIERRNNVCHASHECHEKRKRVLSVRQFM